MKYSKLFALLILISISIVSHAGGMMKGGGPSLSDLIFMGLLLFIGIPATIGAITALLSAKKKKRNFFIAFFITLLAIPITWLVMIQLNS